MAASSSNPASAAGANSNHVRKSNGSPRSRLWCRRRATRREVLQAGCDVPGPLLEDRPPLVLRQRPPGLRLPDRDQRRPRSFGPHQARRAGSEFFVLAPLDLPLVAHDSKKCPGGAGGATCARASTARLPTAARGAPATAATFRTRHLPSSPPANTTGRIGMPHTLSSGRCAGTVSDRGLRNVITKGPGVVPDRCSYVCQFHFRISAVRPVIFWVLGADIRDGPLRCGGKALMRSRSAGLVVPRGRPAHRSQASGCGSRI